MRTLLRNQRPFYYASYTGKYPILDEDGNMTGTYGITHSPILAATGNISPARGMAFGAAFGAGVNYDRLIQMDIPDFPIDENALIWIDTDTSGPNNYRVERIGRSLNYILIAIKQVSTSE